MNVRGRGSRRISTATTSDSNPVMSEADVAQGDRPDDRDVWSVDERRRRAAIWTSHQRFQAWSDRIAEDVVLVDGQVARDSRRVRRPARNGSHSDDDDRQPDRRRAERSRASPPCAQNQAANGRRNGSACGLVISAERQGRRGQPVASVQREDERGQGRTAGRSLSYWPHHALTSMTAGWSRTIATPRRPPSSGFDRGTHRRSAAASPMSASDAGHLHQRPDRTGRQLSVDGPERGLDGRQHAPDVGHHRPERRGSGRRRCRGR